MVTTQSFFTILKENKYFLFFLLISSLLLRILFFYYFLSKDENYLFCRTDPCQYLQVARKITEGEGISKLKNIPNFYRLPGYPLFLSACFKLIDKDLAKALWVQVVLSSFIPLLIFILSFVLFPFMLLLAKIVSVYSVFDLGFLFYSGIVMTESLFLLFFLLFLILFFRSFNFCFCRISNTIFNKKLLFFAGIFLGISSLIRPVGHYILILCLILFLFSSFNLWQKLKGCVLFFSGWLLIVFWWLLRNWLFTGYIFFHTLPGNHFLTFPASFVDSQVNGCKYSQSRRNLRKEWKERVFVKEVIEDREFSEIERCFVAERMVRNCFIKNPLLFLKYAIDNILLTFYSFHSHSLICLDTHSSLIRFFDRKLLLQSIKFYLSPKLSNKFLIIFVYFEIISLFLILLGFLGYIFISFFDIERFYVLLKTLPFICLLAFLTLGVGFARLRLPFQPLLIILSFYFWLVFIKKLKNYS